MILNSSIDTFLLQLSAVTEVIVQSTQGKITYLFCDFDTIEGFNSNLVNAQKKCADSLSPSAHRLICIWQIKISCSVFWSSDFAFFKLIFC